MTEIVYVITVGATRATLNPDEARVVIKGDIPRRLAKILERRGIALPPRGTVPFHIEGSAGGLTIFRSEAHMRRVA